MLNTQQALKKYRLNPDMPDCEKAFNRDTEANFFKQLDTLGAVLIDDYSCLAKEIIEEKIGHFTPMQRYCLLTQTIHFGDSVWLEAMPYGQFLNTFYWQILKEFLRSIYPTCQLCGSDKRLHTHHPTYKNRGWEWVNPFQNLTVLCSGCHAKFHNK